MTNMVLIQLLTVIRVDRLVINRLGGVARNMMKETKIKAKEKAKAKAKAKARVKAKAKAREATERTKKKKTQSPRIIPITDAVSALNSGT